jgi:hypothetical protein
MAKTYSPEELTARTFRVSVAGIALFIGVVYVFIIL